jgi:hypothetical protein
MTSDTQRRDPHPKSALRLGYRVIQWSTCHRPQPFSDHEKRHEEAMGRTERCANHATVGVPIAALAVSLS